ncbi:protein AF1q [Tachysurus ichikawai]
MLDVSSSQFDSFLFWRQPVAALELSELDDLGLAEPRSKDGSLSGKSSHRLDEDDGNLELSEFSTFKYWIFAAAVKPRPHTKSLISESDLRVWSQSLVSESGLRVWSQSLVSESE